MEVNEDEKGTTLWILQSERRDCRSHICGSSSMVEHLPSKQSVASSNLVYRSNEVFITSVVVAPRIALGSLIGALQQAVTKRLTRKEMEYLVPITHSGVALTMWVGSNVTDLAPTRL